MTYYDAIHLERPSSWDLPEDICPDCGYDDCMQLDGCMDPGIVEVSFIDPDSPTGEEYPQEGVPF